MSTFPIIQISDLQRSPKKIFDEIKDYVVVRSHGSDRGFILNPRLGKILVDSGMLDALLEKGKKLGIDDKALSVGQKNEREKELENMIGQVLRELSKR